MENYRLKQMHHAHLLPLSLVHGKVKSVTFDLTLHVKKFPSICLLRKVKATIQW